MGRNEAEKKDRDVGLKSKEEKGCNCVIISSSSPYEVNALIDVSVVAGTNVTMHLLKKTMTTTSTTTNLPRPQGLQKLRERRWAMRRPSWTFFLYDNGSIDRSVAKVLIHF